MELKDEKELVWFQFLTDEVGCLEMAKEVRENF